VAIGALYHEAMHARHTPKTWKIEEFQDLTNREMEVLFMLEEPRIEYLGVKHDEKMQRYLRASGLKVSIESTKDAVRLTVDRMPLSLGRVIAGTLTVQDAEKVREVYVQQLTEDVVSAAEKIITEFVALHDTDYTDMVRLVKQWCETVPEEEMTDAEKFVQILIQAGAFAGIGAMSDIESDERDERREREDRERWDREERQRRADDTKRQPTTPQGVMKQIAFGGSGGTVPFSTRTPTSEERAAAVRLAQILSRVEYTDKQRTVRESYVPPGRVNMKTVIANRGARAAGQRTVGLPEWRETRRAAVPSPTLRVGAIVDVSGSMSPAMKPMAVTNYVLSTALEIIHAKSATVYMGAVGYLAKPKKGTVETWDARANAHNFADATARLDAALDLTLNESGARLAVVAGDGNYGTQEWRAALYWIRTLRKQGVTILWLGYAKSQNAEEICRKEGVRFIRMTGRESPADVATIVGDAAVAALREKKL
jgi:hypothetical protein